MRPSKEPSHKGNRERRDMGELRKLFPPRLLELVYLRRAEER